MESHTELLKANDFVCCFKSCNVLNFYNGVNNARLLHIPLIVAPLKVNTKLEVALQGKKEMMIGKTSPLFYKHQLGGSIFDCFFNSSFLIDVYFFQSSSLNNVYFY